jgi:hypothetical protein
MNFLRFVACLLCCLGLASSTAVARQTFIIAIGVDKVGDYYYSLPERLDSCARDAAVYLRLVPDGATVRKTCLIDENATVEGVQCAIREARDLAQAGDRVIIGCSAHGWQVDDYNHDELRNDPKDKYDEAWCLYDGPLVDDDLYQLWSEFRPGVEIVVLADTCHSGTSSRLSILNTWSHAFLQRRLEREAAEENRLLYDLLSKDGLRLAAVAPSAAKLVEDSWTDVGRVRIKEMPQKRAAALGQLHRSELEKSQEKLPGENGPLDASVIVLAACRDEQVAIAYDGSPSLFTGSLEAVWNGGAFNGTFRELRQAISARIKATKGEKVEEDHTPQIYPIQRNGNILADKRPF